MVALSRGPGKARRPPITLLFVFLAILLAQVSVAQDATTDDSTTTTTSVSSSTESTTTSSSSSSSSSSSTSATTTTSSKSSATTTASTMSISGDTSSTSTGSATSSSSSDGYPIVTVPPTADAPYMQKSNIPEGTLFIAVGAVLGAIGLAILAWRGIVAWSVNRSVRQAAMTRSSESKGLLRSKRRKSRARRSSSTGPGVALDKLGGAGNHQHHRHSHHSHRHHRTSKGPSANSGLFFSPTAGMQHGSGIRRSSYLPAGYYNTNNAGTPPRTQDARYSAADLTGLGGPPTQGYARTKSGPSPPESPGLPQYHDQQDTPPRRSTRRSHVEASTSTVNLASPPAGRTPSAYLEDLFDSHPPQDRA
ncbi:uncharacterized protein BO97DRAFT_403589 [Aspergillus homomorphus CBS 101889]|uniref:REJ domain-containing protein n=1 Tax=Aspergillus homomorphus (strain CBS 101889) TaxID=1450537 RepID=A0A395I8R3_ASPHC|nr:hypothetical protein BO97DRAFT_403589 [Aspergillus homomorphus CBS 101889]RAL15633.1 hypothetical protein BO97DRAFT_403589 [Aspergillus homomorphus CBS 101889]